MSNIEVVEVKDDDSARTSTTYTAFQNNYANVLIQKGAFDEAVKLYEEALKNKSTFVGNSDLRITGLLVSRYFIRIRYQ